MPRSTTKQGLKYDNLRNKLIEFPHRATIQLRNSEPDRLLNRLRVGLLRSVQHYNSTTREIGELPLPVSIQITKAKDGEFKYTIRLVNPSSSMRIIG